jgi:pimeloyl-ACP methyl ester carboxylesterase
VVIFVGLEAAGPLASRTPAPLEVPIEAYIDADVLRVPAGPGSLHVERYGHGGTAVVLLHGFGTSSFLWRAVGPAIANIGHTAFAIDLLGYGESDRPFDADLGIAAQAEYLGRVMTGLRLARAVVVGVDLGGGVALRLAATQPERVERLVLVNTVAFDEVPGRDIRTLQKNTARFALRLTRGVLGVASLLTPLLEGSVADPARMPTKLVARYLAPYVGRDGVSHLLALARSVRSDDLEELELEGVRAPTLVIWGEEDRWLDPEIPTRLVAALPDARLLRFPAAGRLVPEDAPEELTGRLLEFLEQSGTA